VAQDAVFRFPPFVVDVSKRLLLRDGVAVPLTPKAFDVLVLLLEQRDRVVSKRTLLAALWNDSFVEESTVSQHVFLVRQALGEHAEEYVATVARRGYRFVAPVTEVTASPLATNESTGSITDEVVTTLPEKDDDNGSISAFADGWLSHRAARFPRSPRARILLFVTLAGLLASSGVAVTYFRRPASAAKPIRLVMPTPQDPGPAVSDYVESPVVVSPDGRFVIFPAESEDGRKVLKVRPFDSLVEQVLPGTEGASWPFWSPDSHSIGFFAHGKLERIDLTGGAPEILCDAPDARGGTWSRDGVIVFAPTGAGALYRVSAAGGIPTPVTDTRQHDYGHRWPTFMPDGRHFLYLARSRHKDAAVGILAGSLDSIQAKPLVDTRSNVVYVAPDYLLFARAGTLFAQRLDGSRLELTGKPWRVADHVASDRGLGYAAFSVSNNGVLVYRTGGRPKTQLSRVDRGGRQLGLIDAPGWLVEPSLSPDGTRLAVTRGDLETSFSAIWLIDLARQTTSRFTFAKADEGGAVWSPDGGQIAWGGNQIAAPSSYAGLFRRPSSGVGPDVEQLFAGRADSFPTDWSRDGRFIIYQDQDPVTGYDLWALPLTGTRTPTSIVRTAAWDVQGQVSPDGRWLAYSSNVSGKFEVYVQPFPKSGGGKWQVSANGGTQPRWRHDGRELFYLAADHHVMAVGVNADAAAFHITTSKLLFELHVKRPGDLFAYAVEPTGERFVVVKPVEPTQTQAIVVVLNWLAELGSGGEQAR
jgi:DNA-binding winged helix-turn-helix (wHTH) protein/Tol biopolymer transport system component